MKIQFLGVGSAFTTPRYYQSNILISNGDTGRHMLLDCGSDARFSLVEAGFDAANLSSFLDTVYISHLHADHIGGLEWLAFSSYFSTHPVRLKLYAEANTLSKLWDCSLKGGLDCIEGKMMHLTDYFECFALEPEASFQWQDMDFQLQPMPHVISGYDNHYSYALDIHKRVWISTDTQYQPEIITHMAAHGRTIFHDCETCVTPTGVHSHYAELVNLPAEVKQQIWLYHYQPDPKFNPEQDGFLGFVDKGQLFEFN
jgi:ribonuclease BN (tRNA processing enzyme)